MAVLSRADWLKAGRNIILVEGFKGLTLKALLARLGVTSGSFYHHFKNRQAFTEALLEDWEQQMAVSIIESTAKIEGLNERIDTLIEIGLRQPEQTALEVAIRAQAFSDPLVALYVERVDELRIEHCRGLALQATGDERRAAVLGPMIHAIFVGSQQVRPAFDDDLTSSIYQELRRLVGVSG